MTLTTILTKRILVVEAHDIYRGGLIGALEPLPIVESVASCSDAFEALAHPALACADVVVVDPTMIGGPELIEAAGNLGARVILFAPSGYEQLARSLIDRGCTYLFRELMTRRLLLLALETVIDGAQFVSPGAFGPRSARPALSAPRPSVVLNDRELQVLRLVADGQTTREIAIELHYSERTVKNVLHDIITKLNVRNRVQAAVRAVRDGLI